MVLSPTVVNRKNNLLLLCKFNAKYLQVWILILNFAQINIQ